MESSWLNQYILRNVRWPYERRVDAAHAWGVVAVGTAGLVAIPTILATLHATDSHFRWWWPTGWMIVPVAIFLVGLGLTVLPVMRAVGARQATAGALRVTTAEDASEADIGNTGAVVSGRVGDTSTIRIDPDHNNDDDELVKAARSREPAPMLVPGHAASEVLSLAQVPAGHAFISYVREDAGRVDKLQRDLEAAGVSVWRDTSDLWPGEDWRMKIRHAITDNALVFIACFSRYSTARAKSGQNEELILAIDQLRMRRPEVPWLIPVRFDDCSVPDYDLGGERTLASIQSVDLFGDSRDAGTGRLLTTIWQLLEQNRREKTADEKANP